jgi:hypothetical protein
MRTVAWPTIVMRVAVLRAMGVTRAAVALSGQGAGREVLRQRTRSPRLLSRVGGELLKKRTPSKWSVAGPE